MKLRNSNTDEIVVFGEGIVDLNKIGCKNVAEMIEAGWVDYDDSFWYVNDMGGVDKFPPNLLDRESMINSHKDIGNYFKTKRDAEEALEKLKAWKRLRDKGFKFTDWNCPCRELEFIVDEDKFFKASGEVSAETRADLDLLFGGEE